MKLIEQSVRIEELEMLVKTLTQEKRKCQKLRKSEEKFLQSVIQQCKGKFPGFFTNREKKLYIILTQIYFCISKSLKRTLKIVNLCYFHVLP